MTSIPIMHILRTLYTCILLYANGIFTSLISRKGDNIIYQCWVRFVWMNVNLYLNIVQWQRKLNVSELQKDKTYFRYLIFIQKSNKYCVNRWLIDISVNRWRLSLCFTDMWKRTGQELHWSVMPIARYTRATPINIE